MKLIATDMDGTLLNNNHDISDENIQALRFAESQGIELAIATGRVHYDVDDRLKNAGLKAAIIGTNGATVHTKEGELVYSAPLEKEMLTPILKELNDRQLYFSLFTEKGVYGHHLGLEWLTAEVEHQKRQTKEVNDMLKWLTPKSILGHTNRVLNNHQDVENLDEIIYKFVVFSFDPEKLTVGHEALIGDDRLHIVSSGKGNFEVMHRDATKGKGLKALANHLHIPLKETIAMGDNYNDGPMLEVAGISVAMGNAEEPIKEMATMVTKTNIENGVAHAIYKILGEKEKIK